MVITSEMGSWGGGSGNAPVLVERVHLLKSFGFGSSEVAAHLADHVDMSTAIDTTVDMYVIAQLGFSYTDFTWATDICKGGKQVVPVNATDQSKF